MIITSIIEVKKGGRRERRKEIGDNMGLGEVSFNGLDVEGVVLRGYEGEKSEREKDWQRNHSESREEREMGVEIKKTLL